MRLDAKNCVISLLDGAGTPVTAVLKLGDGNITWTEYSANEYLLDRGKIDEVRKGDEQPLDLNIGAALEWYTGDVVGILKGSGTHVTTDTDTCRPYCCDVKIVHTSPCTPAVVETYLFKYYRVDQLAFDLKAATIQASGKCNILEPTVTKA